MMRLSEALFAIQGELIGEDVEFTSVGTDSRHIVQNQLFVALKGEHFDGHDYAQSSLAQGAAAVMLSQSDVEVSPALVVNDTRISLGKLAAYWRSKFAMPLVAVTGSSGKTTVKEMLASVLRTAAQSNAAVLATQGNLNNDIGMPLTLLRLNAKHQFAVIEMGMNHEGEIRYLTKIARPDVVLINNAGTAHIGELGSVEAIARAKAEIIEGLADDGVAIINADDAFAPLWKALAGERKVMTFGLSDGADVSAHYHLNQDSSDIKIHTTKGEFDVTLPVPGLHNVRNALAVAAAALAVNITFKDIALGLSLFAGIKGRLQQKIGINGALVIDDTYNANPASMRAAIDVLAPRSGKKIVVMGDMGELGDDAESLHAEVGGYARQAGIDQLYVLGDLSMQAVRAFGRGAQHFSDIESLAQVLQTEMNNNSTVLVKGSRFMAMERVVNLITTQNKGDAHAT